MYSPFVVSSPFLAEKQRVFVAMTRGIFGFQVAEPHIGMSVLSHLHHAA